MSAKMVEYDLSDAPDALWEDAETLLRPWLVTEPDEEGEQGARCPLHNDKNPSLRVNFAKDLWNCHAGCGGGVIGTLVQRVAYGDTVGDPPNRKRLGKAADKAPTPSVATLKGWHSRLLTDPDAERARHYLETVRGITETTWKEYLLGWDGACITFPVFDGEGAVVNVRKRRPGRGQKMIGLKGHGVAHLYPAVTELPDEGQVFIVEGELDAFVLREHGFPAFTCIGGAGQLGKAIQKHAEAFAPLDVIVWTDADEQGRKAGEEVVRVLTEAGGEPTMLHWPEGTPVGFDVSDLYRRLGYNFAEHVELMLTRPAVDETHERKVDKELLRLRIREDARARFSMEKARERGIAPPLLDDIPSALDWLSVEDTAPIWRIENLIEHGHNVLLGGKDKAGKTTLAIDLAVSLTTREGTWLGEFTVTPPAGKVGWINCEMTDRQFGRWLKKASPDPTRLAVLNLRGNVPNFLDPTWMALVGEWMRRENVSFLIVDSLTEIVSASGLDEDKEGVEVLMALNRFRENTNLSELLVLAHFGHSGERVRGTSKFGGWVDVKMNYVKDESERRYLSADGRLDDALREGEVMRAGDGRLVFQPGIPRAASKKANDERRQNEADELRALVLKIIADEPGLSSTAVRVATQSAWKKENDGTGVGNRKVDDARDALAEEGAIRVEGGGRGAGKSTLHYIAGS